jgi:rod shape-determining protein MreC
MAQRWGSVMALVVAMSAAGVALRYPETASTVRMAMLDVAMPVMRLLHSPVETVSGWSEQVRLFIHTASENTRLREENARLRGWVERAGRLEQELAAYRALVPMATGPRPAMLITPIVGDSSVSFTHQALLPVGQRDRVTPGVVAVGTGGVVGIVSESGYHSARVRLLTDPDSRVPVRIARNGARAMLTGDASAMPQLRYLPLHVPVQAGDAVLTSGDGGIVPPGLPVGHLVQEGGRWRVVLAAPWATQHRVRLLLPSIPQ